LDGDRLRIGQYTLRTPTSLSRDQAVSVAVRPEDLLAVEPGQSPDPSAVWHGTVDQSIDLGHYRKVLVVVPGLFPDQDTAMAHRLKVYMPKSTEVKEGDSLELYPTRYLVYSGGDEPIEVRNQSLRITDENRHSPLSQSAQPARKEFNKS
jgi:hypothetical protein